jgi:hypothetical protein
MFALKLTKSQPLSVNNRGLRSKCGFLEDSDFGIVNKKEIKDMAEFNNNNKKPYNKNNNGEFKKHNYNSSNDNQDREFKKSFNSTPKNNKPKTPAPVIRPKGIDKIPDDAYELISYKMTKDMADLILKDNKGKHPTQEVLCEYVNTQLGLKGYCISVSYF